MSERVVVIGASAGGVEALRELVSRLPGDFPAPVLVVVHVLPTAPSRLPDVLDRAGPLLAVHAADGEEIRPGRIYVAPPNRHLLVRGKRLAVSLGPRENGARPAVDPLFRSAAAEYGAGTVAVILSGALYDGSRGVADVKRAGGRVLVQDPSEARLSSMPRAAVASTAVDHVLPVTELAGELQRLVREPLARETIRMPVEQTPMTETIQSDIEAQVQRTPRSGRNSVYVCPECGGVLWESADDVPPTFECHTGHSYSARHLLTVKSQQVESLLWAAVRTLKEKETLTREFEGELTGEGRDEDRARVAAMAALDRETMRVLGQILHADPNPTDQDGIVQDSMNRAATDQPE
jgi:two-component system, chemotaxis family, protein-glutamate methylesterase/glutaminase